MLALFFLFCIALLVFSQYRLYRAGKQLSLQQILFEFNLSTRKNLIYSVAILIGIIIIVAFPSLISWLILLLIILTIGTWVHVSIYRTLKKKNYPANYLKSFAVNSFFTYVAEIGLFTCFFLAT